ncbi:MAG: 16S rRNA (uracil(1498)-N(3))-methyltransferase [Candidatus Wildermuthbacteria bacterium]|nr:16S rRNA (uracil(1498)-N(3))-methyltransferase [Candidatus Wildermuthbacteria bacterium]
MRLHRFIAANISLQENSLAISDPEIIHQVKNVLRLKTGECFVICDGNSKEATATIKNITKHEIRADLAELRAVFTPAFKTTLYCSILKRENFELVCQKATETGVSAIVPIIAQRTVKTNIKAERLNKIVKEAAEQSGRGEIPVLFPQIYFPEALDNALLHDCNFFFDSSGKPFNAAQQAYKEAGIWIGPEGGWTESETRDAKSKGFLISSLGTFTLRAETAAIIANYLVSSARKNFV